MNNSGESTMEPAESKAWRLGFRPSLDGMRALAVGLVLLSHSGLPLVTAGGPVGVAIFFTLSGFLITSLLLEERRRFGGLNIPAFYRRRFLRLLPAMVTCVALGMTVSMVTVGYIPDWTLVVGTLTYTANWVMIGDFPQPTSLGHTWSLAIEEQFYLVWPALMLGLARLSRARVLSILAAVAVGVVILRALLWDGGAGTSRIYFGFDTRADGLMIGAAMAFALHASRERVVSDRWLWGGLVVIASCCVIPIDAWQAIAMPTVVSVATAGVLWFVVQGAGFSLFELPLVRWVGKRAYGLYLYQAPVSVFVWQTLGKDLWVQALIVPGTVLAAALSYRYVEQPFLRIKDRDPRSHHGLDATSDGGQTAVSSASIRT
ncbi:MAG: acyltransferase [Mycobacterium sp.]